MIEFNKQFILEFFDKALVSSRLREYYDLRHPNSSEDVVLICGKMTVCYMIIEGMK